MKQILWFGFGLIAVIALLCGVFFPRRAAAAEGGNSQYFSPARYALMAADVAISYGSAQGPMGSQRMLFKLDTVSGQVWVLQLAVQGENSTVVNSANWFRVQ